MFLVPSLRRWIPEFTSKELEQEFRERHHEQSIRYARVLLVIGSIAVMLPLPYDYVFWNFGPQFFAVLAIHSVAIALAGFVFTASGRLRPAGLDRWMFAVMCVLLANNLVAGWFRPRGLTADAITWQLTILSCYLVVPLRYLHRLICGMGGTAIYLALFILVRSIASVELGPLIYGIITINLVGIVMAFQIERLRRLEYERLLDEEAANARLAAEVEERQCLATVLAEASLAKSRFLAAASHDLRQPVHALGMFVGALRAREMDAEARKIVDHIADSVHVMNELFSALLDVSRLDAGVVQRHLQTFPIQTLLERIYREFFELAAQKGLRLMLYPCSLFVYSDPVLLERIIRNLAANAVRYSDSGRIVIGCRRRGARLSIQVWDTGRGIGPEHRDQIFHEFYQIGNHERDRSKGMGLGLAIVKRLTALLDTPLTLKSQIGKGSVFAVEAPRAHPASFTPMPQLELRPDLFLQELVLVLDDEIAIQQAMKSLLISWGLSVIAAGTGQEMLDAVVYCKTRPSLILCDYRLREDENGITVIERLRTEFNEDIPGVLISGDTAPDRLKEATESGFVLLHKPVPQGTLRATVTSVIRPLAKELGP
jgi:signal transduction histidine kinase